MVGSCVRTDYGTLLPVMAPSSSFHFPSFRFQLRIARTECLFAEILENVGKRCANHRFLTTGLTDVA